jgi:hypothetical protein
MRGNQAYTHSTSGAGRVEARGHARRKVPAQAVTGVMAVIVPDGWPRLTSIGR